MIFRTPSRAACTLTLGVVLLAATTLLAQQLGALSEAQQAKVAQLVSEKIEASHISQKPIDDAISAKVVDEFVKMLDQQKYYFLQSDIDRFNKFRFQLDEQIKIGNLDFAQLVFDTYLTRLRERMDVAHKLIDAEHDFTVKETIETDAKELPWSKTPEELNERWRKRIKYDLLLLKLENTGTDVAATPKTQPNPEPGTEKSAEKTSSKPVEDPKKRLHKRYKNLYDTLSKTEPDEVVEMYLTALCMAFDPHSSYMSPRSWREFNIQMGLKLEGIGAQLTTEDGYTVVKMIVPKGAAADDGRLKINDKIVAVGNGSADFVDVIEMKLTKVVDMIRGKAGTVVRLKVMTAATGELKVYELTRRQVPLTASEVKGDIIDASTRIKGAKGRIGIIHIPSFYRDFQGAENGDDDFKSTARDVKAVLKDFEKRGGVDAVIVDLRYNGGGALTEAIDVSGLFVDEGPVVQVKDQRGRSKVHDDEERGVDCAKPMVVITNRLSASASEIFAGVIRDYNRGLIVGDTTTHGKGTVQSVMDVSKRAPLSLFRSPQELGALKLTIQQFYRVNGASTQNLGVPSDIVLPSLIDKMDLGEQYLDNAMPYEKIEEVPHANLRMVNAEMRLALSEQSRKRVAANPEFQKVQRDIDKLLARKQRKTVSLNEDELRQERVEEEQKTREKAESTTDELGDGPIFADNAYNNEVLQITLDYLGQLQGARTVGRSAR